MNEKVYSIYQTEQNKKLICFELCGITYPDKSYEITRHNSKTMCIEFVQRGAGVINADAQSFEVGEGDSYFLQSGQNQHYYSHKDNPWTKYWVNISGPLAEKLIDGFNLRYHIYYKNLNIMEHLCNIIDMAKNSSDDSTSYMICELTKIFGKMYSSITSVAASDDIAGKMRQYLDINAGKKFAIKDLCEYVSRSESQTIRIFRQRYGITPYAYHMSKKTELAKSLLRGTNLSIKQIAYNLGFADEYYFSNAFKKQAGMSPGNFRKNS